MNYAGLKKYSIGNGEGVRTSLFVSGCKFHCKECFNNETWDYDYGNPYTEDVKNEILAVQATDTIKGLSLLGGDPLWQKEEDILQLIDLVEETKKLGKTTWIWSGFLWEDVMEKSHTQNTRLWDLRKKLIMACDVWVDGQFKIELKDLKLQWCGSTNQRVIDVQKSLKENHIVLFKSKFTK